MIPTKEQIAERLRGVVARALVVPQDLMHPEITFTDLGVDSLDSVAILMGVEEEFRLIIDDSEAEPVKTFGQLCELVERKLNKEGK